LIAVNVGAADIPAYGVAQIQPIDSGTSLDASGRFRVATPSDDSALALLFLAAARLPVDASSACYSARERVAAAYDPASGLPVVEGMVGSKAGSALLHATSTGFLVVAVDQGNELVYVKG
jgi:hypothetical protein